MTAPGPDFSALVAAIAAHTTPQIPLGVDLWGAQQIGSFLKVSPRYVTEHYALRSDFPRPIRLPSGKGRGHPRWKAREVIKWAERFLE